MNHVIPGASLHHVALSVKKYEKSRDFYCRAFGMSCVNEWEFSGKRLCFLDVGDGNFLELHSNAGKMPPEAGQEHLHHQPVYSALPSFSPFLHVTLWIKRLLLMVPIEIDQTSIKNNLSFIICKFVKLQCKFFH